MPLDFLVHAGILLDEGVGARDVGLRLVKIEIADKVFDGVARKKTFELRVKLAASVLLCEMTSVGLVDVSDDVRDGERFARTGDAQQRLVLGAGQNAGGQFFNRLRLVAGGRVIGNKFKHGLKIDRKRAVRQTGLSVHPKNNFCRRRFFVPAARRLGGDG